MVRRLPFAALLLGFVSTPALGSELTGPARLCGYSPIIDLLEGEKITTLGGGIHGGSFRWDGPFGSMEVFGLGWAAPPKGRIVRSRSGKQPARFAQKLTKGRYQIVIWNGSHGTATFSSEKPFSREQISAIDRVRLFDEGDEPEGCQLRTVFVWE